MTQFVFAQLVSTLEVPDQMAVARTILVLTPEAMYKYAYPWPWAGGSCFGWRSRKSLARQGLGWRRR